MQHPEGTALIYAPTGRDAEVAAALLKDIRFSWKICPDMPTFTQSIGDDTLFAAITEEATRGVDLKPLVEKLQAQPAWSDLPFIFLTRRGGSVEQNPEASRYLQIFGNVTFLERPFHPTTFVSLAQAATRARTRQFEARARIDVMQEGERRLQTALMAGRLGSWELDIATRTLTMSPHCKAIFGFAADGATAYGDLMASLHPDDIGGVLNTIADCMRTGADFALEHRVIWPDSTLHWVESRARVVTEPGKSRRLVGVSSDVTPRRLAEVHLQRVNITLEQCVAVRTAELERAHAAVLDQIMQRERAETLLRQSQKLEMIGQLTGGVAHDFNNLLMAVIGNLDLLSRTVPDEPRTARLLRGAIEGAERGAALTQRLLAFARKQDLQVVPTDMAELV
ncbi:MAG: PAS domain-containing protein, partial [Pseudorhodobacter sp.]|nr:PAS domain-containing protein [Pseudorhodobacter sp.]